MDGSLMLISFGVLQGMILLIAFLAKGIRKNPEYLLAGILTLVIMLLAADYVLSNYFLIYQQKAFFALGWSSSLWFLIAPLYYLLYQSFLARKKATIIELFVHFAPFVLFTLLNIPFLSLSPASRLEYIIAYSSGEQIATLHAISKSVYHLQIFIYPLIILRSILRAKVPGTNFIVVLIICLFLAGAGSFAHMISFNLLRLSFSWFTSNLTFFLLSAFIHFSVLLLLTRPQWMIRQVNEVRHAHSTSNLSGINTDELQRGLDSLLANEKLYLRNDLKLGKVSELINVTPHQLSEYLNKRRGQTFNDYINHYRIEEAKSILLSPAYKTHTIDAIAKKAGFNSTATFYRSFKKATGVSPTAWLSQQARS